MEVAMTKMSSKGQIVIPLEMRDELHEGDKIIVIQNKDQIILKKATKLGKNFEEDDKPSGPVAPWDEMLAREAVTKGKDPELEKAIAIVKQYGNATASLLQRKMSIGFPRAARLMD